MVAESMRGAALSFVIEEHSREQQLPRNAVGGITYELDHGPQMATADNRGHSS